MKAPRFDFPAIVVSGALDGDAASRSWHGDRTTRRDGRRRAAMLRVILLVGAAAAAKTSFAQFGFLYEWNKPGGGNYAVNANWTPSGIPNASNEAAHFGLNSSYNVQLPASDVTVSSLEVAQGNVGLVFASPPSGTPPYTYTANGGLTIGSTGQSGLLLSGSGSLTTGPTTFGVSAGANGLLELNTSTLWSGGATVIGASGDGRLDLKRDASATTAGAVLGQGAAGSGSVDIRGIWNSGNLIVGDAGDGVVNILATQVQTLPIPPRAGAAGRLNSGAVSIAAQSGSSGIVNLNGFVFPQATFPPINGKWNIAGSLAVGGGATTPGGVGRINIASGNIVEVGSDLKVWPGGTLSLFETTDLTVAGAANLGGALEFFFDATVNPQLGAQSDILTAASISGTFSSTALPPLSDGLRWVVDYESTKVSLRVASAFTADFDNDGNVDAADLGQWRGDYGVTDDSDADNDGDSDGADFLTWQEQLGSGPQAIAFAAELVPEPCELALILLAGCGFHHIRRRVVHRLCGATCHAEVRHTDVTQSICR